MANNAGIYQTIGWKEVMERAGYKIADVPGMNAFEKTIVSVFGKRKIVFARGSPDEKAMLEFVKKSKEYFYGTITPKITGFDDALFKKLGFRRVDDFTIMIDLRNSGEVIWNKLEKKSVRWGVKTGEKNELVFSEAEKEDLQEIYNFYSDTIIRGGHTPESFEFFEAVNDILVPAGLAKIFNVTKDGKIVACSILLLDDDHAILHVTGATDEGYKLQAMPFLYWKMIEFSKSLGKKYFDAGGYDAEAREGEKTWNINKFKLNFGGEIMAQPVYATSWKYVFIRSLMKKFRFIKRLYKKVK